MLVTIIVHRIKRSNGNLCFVAILEERKPYANYPVVFSSMVSRKGGAIYKDIRSGEPRIEVELKMLNLYIKYSISGIEWIVSSPCEALIAAGSIRRSQSIAW